MCVAQVRVRVRRLKYLLLLGAHQIIHELRIVSDRLEILLYVFRF